MKYKHKVLFFVPNWLGDSVMFMPTIQVYKELYPTAIIDIVAKSRVNALWKLHSVPNKIHLLQEGTKATHELIKQIKSEAYDLTFVLPNSFRAAYMAWKSGIKVRVGRPGHFRKGLLTHIYNSSEEIAASHQAYDYLDLISSFNPENNSKFNEYTLPKLPAPKINVIPIKEDDPVFTFLQTQQPIFGFLPGSARGPSKQWPEEYYSELGKKLVEKFGAKIIILGTPDEKSICINIQNNIGDSSISYAGVSKFQDLPFLISKCKVIVCNDSGGMHLSSALKVPLIAIFGITNPDKTGPLSPLAVVLQKSKIRSKEIPRKSAIATEALRSITPQEVFENINKILL